MALSCYLLLIHKSQIKLVSTQAKYVTAQQTDPNFFTIKVK